MAKTLKPLNLPGFPHRANDLLLFLLDSDNEEKHEEDGIVNATVEEKEEEQVQNGQRN